MLKSLGVRFAATVATLLAVMGGLPIASAAEDADGGSSKAATSGEKSPAEKTDFVTDKLEIDMLLGKWCGNLGEYFFTDKKLDVKRFSDGKKYSLPIVKINLGNGWIELHFDDSGKKNTAFYEFSKDDQSMAQAANTGGDNGPKMRFRRCK